MGPGPDLSHQSCKASEEPGKMDLYSQLMDTPPASDDTWSPGDGGRGSFRAWENLCVISMCPLSWAGMTLARA